MGLLPQQTKPNRHESTGGVPQGGGEGTAERDDARVSIFAILWRHLCICLF